MGKNRNLASTVSNGGILENGAISIADVTGLQTALDGKLDQGAALSRSTSITLSGSSAEFSVPSWAKKITMLFRNMSASGLSTGAVQVQLGTAGQGYLTSGYNGILHTFNNTSLSSMSMSICFLVNETNSDAYEYTGIVELYELEPNLWVERGHTKVTTSRSHSSVGDISLSERLTNVRFYIGVGSFDGGKVNVFFE